MSTFEGCSTISDSTGKLLFYTDGITVWDKNHQIMPNGNGLKGDTSTTQSAIIVPKPNSTTIYYIFTCAAQADVNGLRYSVLDMTLNSGLGDITIQKNILLSTPVCEKLTAVKNENSNEYWVVAHGYGNNQFLAYKITNTGVNHTAVTSNVGIVVDTEIRRTVGYLKFSPRGRKLISCNNYYIGVELYDFDASTGLITNPRKVNNLFFNYGVEFSPSENIAYVSGGIGESIQLFQYDLTVSDIPSSQIVLKDRVPNGNFFTYFEAMQLAKNGKIYGAILGSGYVFEIEKPNILGTGCNVILDAVSLGTGICQYGLPQFIQSFFKINAKIDIKNTCFGDTSTFSISADQTINNVVWDFGDGTTSLDINPSHVYLKSGVYTISATVNTETVLTESVTIAKIPTATKPQDILACDDYNDGFYSFDLTTQNPAILNGQDPDQYLVTYFSNGVPLTLPTAYVNSSAYVPEIITAEVSNKVNPSCKSSTSFNIAVFDSPKANLPANIPDLTMCDNTSVGTDTDGRVIFDLTQRETTILEGQSATQYVVSYFKDALFTQQIALPKNYQNTTAAETIFVNVANKDNINCYASSSFKIEVFSLPTVAGTVSLKQCDDDIDGFSNFNLEEAITKITVNSAVETITFHKTLADAQNNSNVILNQTAYRNQIVSSDKVYARVVNNNNCYRVAQLNLIVSTTQIPSTYSKTLIQCDDTLLGTNKDGIASFDFSTITTEIENIFPLGQQLDISYYQNIKDALSEKNAIADISNYRNESSPNSQKIFIRVDSKLNNDCLGLGGYITLKVESVPEVKSITRIHCDDDQDGLYAFDTSNLEQELLNGLTNVSVSYLDHNNAPLPSPLPNPFITNSQIIKVVVTNNTPTLCSFDSTISFVVDDLPEVFPIDPLLTIVCDDEIDPVKQDGKYAFNTATFESALLGSQTGMIVKYYDSNNNLLSSPLPNPFLTGSQNVKVEVINPINASCSANTVIGFVVNPVPKITLEGEELVCSNLPTFTKEIDAGLLDLSTINDFNYRWSFNGTEISDEQNYSLTVNKEGIFTVEVSNKLTHCARTRTIKVSASDIASNVIAVVDESNTISVSVSGNGDYVYALDDNQNGYYQKENVFLNVPAGIHIVYIKDQNGCGVVQKEIAVFGIPDFFTPNQDGYHDYWNVEGLDEAKNAKTTIQIFDRYGKFLKQISPSSQGWDGTYIGMQMPADDYWYIIKLEDNRVFKGHFALKR
ncbi:PKD domain-containing protein [Flavobacterium pectinovorum]|uniref:PKD domain-containing protein n=2 Tax=Flavobacterium pectinovorum TaxID=29533 RepID=A0A502ECJ2_9FLAO|nr:PKD domain-containing protein [Flavobacterium pectinovorum]